MTAKSGTFSGGEPAIDPAFDPNIVTQHEVNMLRLMQFSSLVATLSTYKHQLGGEHMM